jgi:hypothetical protein
MAIAKVIEKKGGEIKKGFNGGSEQRYTNGKKGKGNSRYSDGTATDANGDKFEVQTVDTKADGSLTTRETEAAADIAELSGNPVVCLLKSCGS